MKFSCTQENLKRGLLATGYVAGRNVNLPILNNVLIKIEGSSIQLISTNLEIAVRCIIRGKVDEGGEYTVPSKLFMEYVNLLPDDRVDLETTDAFLKVACRKNATKIKGIPASEFPLIPTVDRQKTLYISGTILKRALGQVNFAISSIESRPELTGALFNVNPSFAAGSLVIAATDSYRLSEKTIALEAKNGKNSSQESFTFVVPGKSLQEIVRILALFKENELEAEPVEIAFGEGQVAFSFGDVALVLYTAQPLSPSLLWHFDLMLRLLAEFHAAKRRSLALQQLTYLSAVHETGARLTHDIKNLLQSLTALCFAAERESDPPSPHFRQLMQRQLPQLAQRLQATLDALNRPDTGRDEERSALVWWESLLRRYEGSGIRFSCVDPPDDSPVPVDLLDNVADNLLRNVQAKRASEAGTGVAGEPEAAITVRVRFADGPALSVEDNGRPVPDAIARQLFRAPVDSATGFGIGLLQAARYAERRGFVLRLAENRPGRVRFQLEPAHSVRLATAVPASTLPARR